MVVREVKKAMTKSDALLQPNSSTGCHLWKVLALLSLFVSHNQEEAKGKRTLAMYNISRAHFHGAPVRRVCVELLDEEKERLARENGPDLKYTGLLKKVHVRHGGCECSLASALRADPEGAQFRPRPQQSCIIGACGTGHQIARSRW